MIVEIYLDYFTKTFGKCSSHCCLLVEFSDRPIRVFAEGLGGRRQGWCYLLKSLFTGLSALTEASQVHFSAFFNPWGRLKTLRVKSQFEVSC